ncbi:sulfatase-like hydrolase/transferase [Lutibacter citreus]|uniref:sulfatase-like hydrolase/transferase n=1 Tax=Lutibacter citreus TaxID=2138210 RepID=UPI000DBE16F7|nr:sulfatase-like hydrolase/transferase [Lutibacter citreus]
MKRIILTSLLCIVYLSSNAQEKKILNETVNKKRPNFLFILVDDQSPFDLKTYDAKSILETPNIDKLAKEGIVFDSARNMGAMNGAVCTPSRHMIMSGRTVWNLPRSAGYNKNINCPDSLQLQTIGAVFNRDGYKTMRTCKKGNSYAAANNQFSVIHDAVKRGGTEETGSAWHSKQVLNYLENREESKEVNPFFIYFGFSHPHDERNGTPELLAKYGATNHTDPSSLPPKNSKQPELQDNYLSAHPFFHGHKNLRDEERVIGVWKNRDEQTVRNELGREYACDENIDIQIGKVLKKLEEMNELDNTYIIYTSDHGIAIGRHGLMGKQNLYEHTSRVPFIVKGPKIKAGQRVKGNVYLLDILPTVCDLAGIDIPKTVQGVSFKPLLEGKRSIMRDVMYGVYCGGSKPGMRSVVKGDWKLIKYDLMEGTIRKTQLFNLAKNPNEYLQEHKKTGEMETNLANNPIYAEKLAEMEKLLLEQMIENNDPYRLWDQVD